MTYRDFMNMKLGVYTIEKTLFDGEAEKIIAETSTGEITVLDGHVPLVSELTQGEIRILDPEKRETRLRRASSKSGRKTKPLFSRNKNPPLDFFRNTCIIVYGSLKEE